jgi:hypothetical protein
VPRVVARLAARRREGDELIAGVEEGHLPADPPAQLEGEDPPVELERPVDVPDLERDVADADEPGPLIRRRSRSPIRGP